MKATEAKFLDFLKKSPQFVIPIYQRTYSWSKKECRQLWDDILSAGRSDAVSSHFVGSIVYVENGLYQVSSQSSLLVIDGQQRLTTITLLIEALARSLGDDEPFDGFSAKKLRNYYLLNHLEDGERRYKLILSQTDKTTLVALLDQSSLPEECSSRILGNFEFFLDRLIKDKEELEAVCKGLAKLMVVDIALNRNQDNPQLIFESMNSTGCELSQTDLIRNFILMGLEPTLQTRLYNQYWRPMEVLFGQESYAKYFDSFIRHYLVLKTGAIPNVDSVYEAFKQYQQTRAIKVEELLADIHNYAKHYCAMAFGGESDPELKNAFEDIKELKVDVAFPFLLELYHDYSQGGLSKKELVQMARLVESYVFRRVVCGIPTNSMKDAFVNLLRGLKKDCYLESIQAGFLLLPSYLRFPDDLEFKRSLCVKDLYNFRSKNYWLRRFENHDRKERVHITEYSIEHILPQTEKLSNEWQLELGPDYERIQKTYLHTLGNLTLTAYNVELGDRPYREKRDMQGGFAESPLRINKSLKNIPKWTEEAISNRACVLADQAVHIWVMPKVELLDLYRPNKTATGYTIEDHKHLSGSMRSLFNELRKQVLALDPGITEECRKLYIVYKADANFLDVAPYAKKLELSLNIEFSELVDPRRLCRDASIIGHRGNGNVTIPFTSVDELPYIMGLIRQSFKKQIETESFA